MGRRRKIRHQKLYQVKLDSGKEYHHAVDELDDLRKAHKRYIKKVDGDFSPINTIHYICEIITH